MYGYLKLPYTKEKKPERNQKKEQSVMGALKSVASGDFSDIDGIASSLSKGVSALDEINSKFNVIGMTQLLADGKISNSDALNYLCTGLAPQLGYTAVAMGYQSVDALKSALSSGNLNVGQFFSSMGRFTDYLSEQAVLANINKEQVIFIDLVLSENFTKAAETAERRVQSGQTLAEFVHILPPYGDLNCQFIEKVNYAKDEFEWQLDYLINKKVPITVQLGAEEYPGYVLTKHNPIKDRPVNGYEYTLNFKKINVGSVEIRKINIQSLKAAKSTQIVNVVKNPAGGDKTESKKNLGGIKEIWADANQAYNDFMNNN